MVRVLFFFISFSFCASLCADSREHLFQQLYSEAEDSGEKVSLDVLSVVLASFDLPGGCKVLRNQIVVPEENNSQKHKYLALEVQDRKGESSSSTLHEHHSFVTEEGKDDKRLEVTRYTLITTRGGGSSLDWLLEQRVKDELIIKADNKGIKLFTMGFYREKKFLGRKFWKRLEFLKCKR